MTRSRIGGSGVIGCLRLSRISTRLRALWLRALALMLATGVGAAGAHSATPGSADFPVAVRDALGNQVTVPAPPRRIVALAPAITEILFALGLGDRIVGVTEYCDYPPEAARKPKIGGIVNPSVERILAQRPDLALGMRLNPKPVLRAVANAGVPTYAADPRSVEQIMATIRTLGALTGRRQQAAELITQLRARLQAVRRKTRGQRRPTVMLLYSEDPLWVAGADTFPHHVIRLAGGRNVAGDVRGYKQYSVEMLLAHDPEVILLTSMAGGDDAARLRAFTGRPSMRRLSAVKHKRIHVINADIVNRAGPRIIEGIEQVAENLHPEVFRSR